MKKLYLSGLDPLLAPVIEEFDRLCAIGDVRYQIVEDCPTKQVLRLCGKTSIDPIISRIRLLAAPNTVAVKQKDDTITVRLDRLAESVRSSYCLSEMDDPVVYDSLQNDALRYIGEKYRSPLANLFKGMSVPVRVKDVQSLWKSHENHSRWGELGEKKGVYALSKSDFPPIVVDTVEESAEYPSGKMRDGFRRLYRAHHRGDSLVETVDLKDMLAEARKLVEDQYKSPNRKMIRTQSAHPSSFEPSKSFGNIKEENLFSEQIDRALEGHNPLKPVVSEQSDFESQINEAMGGSVSFVEPDILLTITPKISDDVIEETLTQRDGEWVLLSKKTGKVLRRFGKNKPSDNTVNKSERQIQYFKRHNG